MSFILFFIGLVILIKGADLLVDGASSIAKKLKISSLVIGLTVVAFGTSAPELIVNIIASFQGNADIAIGNVLGSNISNILLILGITAIIFPLAVTKGTVWKEIPLSLLAVFVLFFLANDALIDKAAFSAISRIDGFILLSFFLIFIIYTIGIARTGENNDVSAKKLSQRKAILFVIVGLAGLTLGGKWVVDGAVAIATIFGVSQSLIALTIVAVGTSLPELVTSAVAAYKKQADIAVGNIVGSNIFNVFWILGLSSVIKPLPFKVANDMDIFVNILASALLFIFLFIGKKRVLERWQGILFVLLYAAYLTYLIIQG
ncbi:calcium/sodium antiporter [Patescibacteria group bacterium]|nr:calcium/sodium antiporter [Patescibacteria group bacterium]